MRNRWSSCALISCISCLIYVIPAHAQTIDPADLAFFTDDDALQVPGCDAVSVLSTIDGRRIADSKQFVSPGRLAVASGARWIVSSSNNPGPFLVLMSQLSINPPRWDSAMLRVPIITGGAVAISPNDSVMLFATASGMEKHNVSSFQRANIGAAVGTYRCGTVAAIQITPDSSSAAVIRTDGLVDFVDIASMTKVGASVPYIAPYSTVDRQIRQTFAAITNDGHYLLINSASAKINVIDMTDRSSHTISLAGVTRSYGISVNNHSNAYHFVVHSHNAVEVFRLVNADTAELLARTSIKATRPLYPAGDEALERVGLVAWTGRGDGVIASQGGPAEFKVFDFVQKDSGYALVSRLDLDTCVSSKHLEMPLDVATLNGRLPTAAASPSVSPSATAMPTPTLPLSPPSPTVTATAPPSATTRSTNTATATVTLTPPPSPIYLPLALNEHCTPTQRRTDAILVIDASTSMLDRDASGAVKLDAAINAARAFIALLDLHDPSAPVDARNPGDQAALIAFNADAQLLQPLTTDPNALASAFARIVPASQTCLVCAVDAAAAELASPRHRDGNVPVVVLLTDGRANPRPAGEAVDAAARAKAAGVTFFTIGLGDDVDDGALEAIAAPGGRYYRAVTADGLAEVYRQVAGRIPCPADGFWGKR